MAKYYVNNNAQSTGEHEVHKEDCLWMPSIKTPLGGYSSCKPAVEKAKEYYSNVDGCKHCCEDCHER